MSNYSQYYLNMTPRIGTKMTILPYVVLLWPWPLTFWPWNVVSSSLCPTTQKLYIRSNSHKPLLRYHVNKLLVYNHSTPKNWMIGHHYNGSQDMKNKRVEGLRTVQAWLVCKSTMTHTSRSPLPGWYRLHMQAADRHRAQQTSDVTARQTWKQSAAAADASVHAFSTETT